MVSSEGVYSERTIVFVDLVDYTGLAQRSAGAQLIRHHAGSRPPLPKSPPRTTDGE